MQKMMALLEKDDPESEILNAWRDDSAPLLEEKSRFLEAAEAIERIRGLTLVELAFHDDLIDHLPILRILDTEAALYYFGSYLLNYVRSTILNAKQELAYFGLSELCEFVKTERMRLAMVNLSADKKTAIHHAIEFLLETRNDLDLEHWRALADFSLLVKQSIKRQEI